MGTPRSPFLTSACEHQRMLLVGGLSGTRHPCLVPFVSLGLASGPHLWYLPLPPNLVRMVRLRPCWGQSD